MKDSWRKAVETENEQKLIKCLHINLIEKIDLAQYESIEKALIGTWHSQHEDIVNTIYLANLNDDRFVEPILNIALNRDVFRWYDDELESTLRKCVHALKTINSKKSIIGLEKLKNLDNSNVKSVLDMYE